MKKRSINTAVFVLIVLLLSVPTAVVLANSLPLPFQLYLRFFSADDQTPPITGVQLVGCDDLACSSPQNLIQFGNCSAPGFLLSPPAQKDGWQLDCAGSRCLLQTRAFEMREIDYMQVRYLQTGLVLSSQIVQAPDCDYCTVAWKVDLGQTVPDISMDEKFKTGSSLPRLVLTYLLTIVVEIAVAFIAVMLLGKTKKLPVKKTLLSVLLVNVLSYPVSWLVIPSFGQFQTDAYRKTSLIVTAVIAIVTLASILLHKNQGRIKKWVIIILVISVPICAILFLATSFLVSYGNHVVHANGLPGVVVVILAEVFAVVYESLILNIFLKGEISFQKILLFSLIANGASFLLGFDLFNLI